MSALARFARLFTGDDATPAVEGVGEVTTTPPDNGEQAACEALGAAQTTLADLTARRDSTIKTIEALVAERSRVGRGLATGEATDADFAQAESALGAALARRDGLDALLAEAEDARRGAQEKLNEVSAPRREGERRARVEAATAKAQAASERFTTAYAETSAALAVLADELDSLAALDTNAAHGIGYELGVVSGDPMLRLTRNLWTIRPWSQHVGLRYTLVGLVPPKDR